MMNLVSFRVSHYTRLWFNPSVNPNNAMGGSARMHDPSEAEHDRIRRRWMNIAFVALVAGSALQSSLVEMNRWDWLEVLLLVVAGVPLGLAVKVFELRFKLAREERDLLLAQLPKRRHLERAAHAVLAVVVFATSWHLLPWGFWGVWLYDFITYYHDRPERLRHLYAVTKTLDELRDFPLAWLWAVPAVIGAVARRL
ncbi:MAG: hypothetical protein PCFJNLEI_02817 [Verrucomicrobiae bacterium]|nr:hypothetical protein [Verrucomicrobiae bacterium]